MCLLTIAAYASSLTGWFVYEDSVIPDQPWIVRGMVRWSHEATRWLAGDGPWPGRILNLAWHVLNGLLLWLVVRPVVTTAAALFAVGLFVLHPLQTESVAYLASRPELIAAMWLLLACLASSRGHLWWAGICAALTLTGKEMGVMAWLLVPLWAWASGQTWPRAARWLWAVATVVMLGLFTRAVLGYATNDGAAFGQVMPWSFYGVQLAALWRLLALLPEALVHPSALTIDHDWSWITAPIALAALIGTAALVERGWRSSRLTLFALLWTLVALAPRLIVPMPDGLHERHLYSAMPALSLALGVALFPRGTT